VNQRRRQRFGVRIAELQRQTGLPHNTLLRDHALSYMLGGIAAVPELVDYVVFKGGTALRKCFFAGYRFSEDLDFSSRDLRVWTQREIMALLRAACGAAQALAENVEVPYTFTPQYQQHREDKSHLQHDVRITVDYPTGASLPVKFELTQVEPILRPIHILPVIHGFPDEPFDVTIPVYALDEVVLEKLRAFLQTAENLGRRDWTNRARDLYDLWWLWTEGAPVSWGELIEPLREKAAARGVGFDGPADFLDARVLRSYRDSWPLRLGNLVPRLPEFTDALDAYREAIGRVFRIDPPSAPPLD